MQQSLKILQAPVMELAHLLRESLETNPVLEDSANSISLENIEQQRHKREQFDEQAQRGPYSDSSYNNAYSGERNQQDFYLGSMVEPQTLQSHLQQQLHEHALEPQQLRACEIIIASLNERGFLEETLGEISWQQNCPLTLLEQALVLVQQLEPAGIAARNARHSLQLQAERLYPQERLIKTLLEKHLDLLAKRQFGSLSALLGCSQQAIEQAFDKITRLSLNPAAAYCQQFNPHISPDVYLDYDKNTGQFSIRLASELLPQLKISDVYKDLLVNPKLAAAEREYLRGKIKEARSVIKSLEQRQSTLLAIVSRLAVLQRDYWLQGKTSLKALTMQQIASELELHPTTVSRAIASKYIKSPQGLEALRNLFTQGVKQGDGEQNMSNSAVRQTIAGLIRAEDAKKPLSDNKIVALLQQRGITLARRTVTKYREQLGILPTHLRKHL